MAQLFTLNAQPATGAIAMFNFKEAAKAAGATVPRSGDGTTYNSSGDQITTGASGAGGMGNTNAWFNLVFPDGRSYVIQRMSGDTSWRVKYSFSGGFTGGSPSATRVPSATDEGVVKGAGTDASPTGSTLFYTNNTYYHHMMFTNAAPYAFYDVKIAVGGGTGQLFAWLHDPLTNYDLLDQDPTIIYCSDTGTGGVLQLSNYASGTAGPFGWLKYGLAGAAFTRIAALIYSDSGGQIIPTNCPTNPHSGVDDEFPVPYGRKTALGVPVGWKGLGTLARWRGQDRSTPSLIDLDPSGDPPQVKNRLVVGNVSLPWDGATALVI